VFYFLSTVINYLLSWLHCAQKTFFTWSTDGEYARLPSDWCRWHWTCGNVFYCFNYN